MLQRGRRKGGAVRIDEDEFMGIPEIPLLVAQ